MQKLFSRSSRISQELQKKIALIIQHSLQDPRIKEIITVSEVKVSKDLSYARVFVSFLKIDNVENILNTKKYLSILNKSSGYIRKLLCKKIRLRIIPNLVFYHDDSLLIGNNISKILNDLIKKREHIIL